MFEEKNINFEKMKIFLTFGKYKFNIRDAQLIFFIELLDKLQKINKQLKLVLNTKTKLEEEEEKQMKEDKNKEKKDKEEKENLKKKKN